MRKVLRLAVRFAAAIFLSAMLVNALVIGSAKRSIISPDAITESYDCILVLGCKVYGDKPSDMLRDRLDRAIALYRSGASARILMSGDHGNEPYNEVGVMKRYAVQCGVPAEAVFMDHAGFSTYESMYRAKDVFGVQRVLIVTQPYHLYRAVYDARRLGLDAQGTAAMPNAYVFPLYNTVREALARNKDFAYTLFKPKLTYLGDPIPITGSGAATDDKYYYDM